MLTALIIIAAILAWFAGAILSVYGGLKGFEKLCPNCFAEPDEASE